MQKTVAAKLIPSKTQAQALKSTLAVFADACNQALKVAQKYNVKRAFDIHRLCYRDIKAATGLTSNYVVRAIGRLAQSFGKKKPPKEFKPTSLDLDKDLIRFIPSARPFRSPRLRVVRRSNFSWAITSDIF
jgi:putative transposase